ncbi:MAG TPA: hypothetical protein VJI75_06485 [Candidatus Nanoarchaeia archaeon]|nr:hypothetical protein [Candidatus Nanoarchaeia archaeon]
MAGQTFIADLSLWDEKRRLSIFGYINDVRKERRTLKDIRADERTYVKILKDIEHHRVNAESKEFKSFVSKVKKTNSDFNTLLQDLFKLYAHSLAMQVALKHVLKEAGIKHDIPENLEKEQISALNDTLAEGAGNIDTMRLAATKLSGMR